MARWIGLTKCRSTAPVLTGETGSNRFHGVKTGWNRFFFKMLVSEKFSIPTPFDSESQGDSEYVKILPKNRFKPVFIDFQKTGFWGLVKHAWRHQNRFPLAPNRFFWVFRCRLLPSIRKQCWNTGLAYDTVVHKNPIKLVWKPVWTGLNRFKQVRTGQNLYYQSATS